MEPTDTRSEDFVRQLTGAQTPLYVYIMSLVADGELADDILQQTNVVLWRESERFEPGTSFHAWACRVAYYEVLSARKRISRDHLLFDETLLQGIASEAAARADATEDRRKALRQCLSILSDAQRRLLASRYVDELPINRIASEMNRPANSICQTLYRIRNTLADCIQRKLADGETGGGA